MRMRHEVAVMVCVLLVPGSAVALNWDHCDAFSGTMGLGQSFTGGGSGYPYPDGTDTTGSGGWYEYPSGWVNQWFYDGVYDPDRWKLVRLELNVYGAPPGNNPYTDTEGNSDYYYFESIEVALNWATAEWSALGTDLPPLLTSLGDPLAESLYIGRLTLDDPSLWEDPLPTGTEYSLADNLIGRLVWEGRLPVSYNPEWVSIDVRGNYFRVDGTLCHSCVVPEPGTLVLLGLGLAGIAVRKRRTSMR